MSKGKFVNVANAQANKSASSSSRYGPVPKRRSWPSDTYWRFGFQFFRQIPYFGLDGRKVPNSWMISLLDRLAALNTEKLDDLEDYARTNKMRYHPINWSQKNIPIQLSDIDWVPQAIKDDPEQKFCQFQLSTARGRVVGFFDSDWVFQIVLLDPLHNIQPSKDYDYAVDHCTPLDSEYHALEKKIHQSIEQAKDCDCGVATTLSKALQSKPEGKTLVVCLHCDTTINQVNAVMDLATDPKQDVSVAKVFAAGVEAVLATLP